MRNDDYCNWRVLVGEMSEISERAFHAGWMDGLEYRLWEVVQGGPRKYGEIEISDAQVARLRFLADTLDGWIWFNEESGIEEFIDRDRWQRMYSTWSHRRQSSDPD